MTKKVSLLPVLTLLIAQTVFTQSGFNFGIGAGGYFTSDLGGGAEILALINNVPQVTASIKNYSFGGGAFVFLDTTYLEISLGLFIMDGGWTAKENIYGTSNSIGARDTGLDIGLLGKYPIKMTERITGLPYIGITWRPILAASLNGTDLEETESPGTVWLKFGLGLDYAYTGAVFFRGGVFYGIRLVTKIEEALTDTLRLSAYSAVVKTGQKVEVKFAVGYKF